MTISRHTRLTHSFSNLLLIGVSITTTTAASHRIIQQLIIISSPSQFPVRIVGPCIASFSSGISHRVWGGESVTRSWSGCVDSPLCLFPFSKGSGLKKRINKTPTAKHGVWKWRRLMARRACACCCKPATVCVQCLGAGP